MTQNKLIEIKRFLGLGSPPSPGKKLNIIEVSVKYQYARLGQFQTIERTSLLQPLTNYSRKKVYTLGPIVVPNSVTLNNL